MQVATADRNSFLLERYWWSAQAPLACKSPKNSCVWVERFISQSGSTAECRAVIVAAILSGGYRPSDWTRHLWRNADRTVHCHWSPVLMAVTPSTSDSWLPRA